MTKTAANASQIGRFKLSHHLGRDSIATVYLAHDPRDDSEVAIKLLHSQVDAAAALQRIRVQQLDRVQHFAICRLLSVGQHQGLSYLAYEYVDGSSLAQILAGRGVRNREKLPMIRALVQGLAALHERGICHLGLTPARIKVTSDNKPKILGIGRPALLDAAGESAMVKRSELRYMAPEQLDSATGNERTDVFRLCLVLFELISGKSAIRPASIKETRKQLQTFAPSPDALGTSSAAIKLMAFLRKGLATDPEQRYPDAIQMLAAMPRTRVKPNKPGATSSTKSPKEAAASTSAAPDDRRTRVAESAPSNIEVEVEVEVEVDKDALLEAQTSGVIGDGEVTAAAPGARQSDSDSEYDGIDSDSSKEDHDETPPAREQRANQPVPKPAAGDGDGDGAQTLAYILDRLATSNDFPALSQSIFEVNQLTSLQANATVSQIAEVILRDYALSNKLLKLANSAYYGVRVEVTRVTDAIRLLGFEQVRITANGLAYTAKIGPGMEQLRDAMLKSFASGLVARQLADDVQINDSEEAFLCAMFYDTGEHLTIHYLPQQHAKVIDALQSGRAQNKADAATEVFGLTFAALGAAVARSWRFPETIVTAIEGETADGEPLDDAQLLQLSWIARGANDLCELAGRYGPDEADSALQELAERLKEALSLDKEHLRHALYEAAGKAQALAPVLGIDANDSDYMQALAQWGPPPSADEQSAEESDDNLQNTAHARAAS